MTVSIIILAVSVALQLMAVGLILRFIRFSRGSWSWGAVALAIGLMAMRRSITLFRLLTDGANQQPDLMVESVALVISLLLVLGFCSIAGLLRSLQTASTQLATDLESAVKRESGLRTALNSIDEAILAFGKDARIEFASEPVERIFGRQPDELIGEHFTILVADTDAESRDFEKSLKRFIDSDVSPDVSLRREVIGVRGNGTSFPLQISVHSIPAAREPRFVATLTNINERVEREQRVEESRKQVIAELEHKHEILSNLAEGVSGETGADFFRSLVEYLGRTLNTKYALAASASEEWLNRADTLAIWGDGEYLENFDYDLAGTPCADVLVRKEICVYAVETQALFPDDKLMIDMGVYSYAGAPLIDSSGAAIGLIAVMDDKELVDVDLISSALRVFASRATAELERLKAQKQLSDNEAWYRGLFEVTSDCILVLNRDGDVIDENTAARKALEYSHEELVALDSVSRLWPSIADEFTVFLATDNEMHSMMCKAECLRKDGESFVAEIRADFVTLNAERNLFITIRDVSEQERTQRSLRLAQFSIENSLDAVFWVKPDATVSYVNNAACQALEYTREELLSMTVHDINPSIGESALQQRMDLVRAKGSVFVESTHRTKRGHEFPVELMIGHHLVRGEEFFLVSARDLTQRKRSESDIKKSARRIRSIIESANEAIIALNENQAIIEWNPQAERMLGWSAREALGKTPKETFIPKRSNASTLEQFVKEQREQSGSELTGRAEVELMSKSGEVFPVEINLSASLVSDGVTHTAFIRDLRLQKKLEAQSIRAEKLESIGILAGGIAHDFNNLLTGVLGNIALANKTGELHPQASQFMNEAEQALSRASDLTRQLLTFAKGGAPVTATSSILELLTETVVFALRGTNAKPVFHLPEDLHAVEMDSSQISQVLHNLCINATHAMPEGGTVTVTARNTMLGSSPAVRIDFSDEGVGIPAGQLTKIFDPFFTTKEFGTGLGLATSYSIIKKHGGTISVDSKVNHGTTFTIVLPATLKKIEKKTKRIRNSLNGRGRILVMDDEAFLRRMAKSMIEGYGYAVDTAVDGLEALSKYQSALSEKKPFDLVILDLTIPGGVGGKETVARLKEIDPGVRAIVCSGYAADQSFSDYERLGFVSRVAKPYRPDDIAEAIHDALNVEAPLS